MPRPDPIRLELMKNAFAAVADEMAATVIRTARSSVIKEAMDFSTGLLDPQGNLIAQGLCLPVHMGSFPPTLATVLEKFGGQMNPGDVYAINDPYTGSGLHLPDIFVFKPVFHDGKLLAFAAAIGHQTDIGGRVAGGNACDNTEIFQEGLRIPPLRIIDQGRPVEAFFDILQLNVRVPDTVMGDVQATIAACTRGERGLIALAKKHGGDILAADMANLLNYSEALTRAEFAAFPDGEWEFEDFLDDDGFSEDPIRLFARVVKKGTDITLDFTGTSKQVKGSINLPIAMTKSCVYACLRTVIDLHVPTTSGFMRPIRVIAEPGSIVNPISPAPVAARGLTSMRVTEAIWGALAKMLPDKVFACGAQGDFGVTIAGYREQQRPFVLLEFLFGTWGGRPDKDAIDALSSLAVNYSNTPVEIVEREQPIQIEEYGFRQDSCGPGKFRGGLAMVREYRLVGVDEAVLQVRSDRQKFRPYGLNGGAPGANARNFLKEVGGRRSALPGKFMRTFKRGETYRAELAGGGGWGNAFERTPELVRQDVIDEKISVQSAATDYGVAIGADGVLDEVQTARLRAARRAAE
ncbi:MAG: hydantoinase B/oxoprolinase family protein [Alphaproteobacteria bacterium]|nr:hydantoinase B/oxoprolinase family protein [Alphaproteobacteria bacterium]